MTSQKFSTEYLPLAPMLYRIAFHILEQQDEAEDAVQETFLKLWEIRDKLDDVESAKAYSIRILKNECLDRLRKAKKSVPADQVLVREPISPTDEQIDARRRLEKVLGAMGMSQLTLRVLLTRARGALRNLSGRKI